MRIIPPLPRAPNGRRLLSAEDINATLPDTLLDIPQDGKMPPPSTLTPAAKALWIKMRDELAGGVIPTPGDAMLLGLLAEAKVRQDEAAREARNLPKGIEKNRALMQERHWSSEVRMLTSKCKFLRDVRIATAVKAPSEFTALLKINQTMIDALLPNSTAVQRMEQYIDGVLDGLIPAGKTIIRMCERHREDLARVGDGEFRYKFSAYLADRACRLIESLPHVKGKWAKHKQLLHLEPWQCFIVCSLFGWVNATTNLRRFREAYLEICRKNGKSILAAAIGIVMFLGDEEHGAEVYSGATSEKQAWEVFRPARLMLVHSKALAEDAKVEINAKSLVKEDDESRFEPIIGKPGDGASPSCAIADEFHEHDTPDLVDTMLTGMLAREQPLLLKITTAGYNLAGPCYEHRKKALQVLNGVLDDDSLFVAIYTIDLPTGDDDPGDDWTSVTALRKANPNLGVSVDEEFLLAMQRSAMVNVSEETRFKTKHLDVWCSAGTPWVSLQQWQAGGDKNLRLKDCIGASCWFAFDLASKSDIAAYVILFRRRVDGRDHYYVFGRYYLPEQMIHEAGKNQLMYQTWHKQGLLTLTEGATTDFERIKDDIIADAKIYGPSEVVYDPFNATHMSQLLLGEGLNLVEFTQTPANFAVPMDEVQAALKDKRLHHDDNEMLTWMISNVTVRPAKKGLFWPTKESPELKIDGPVAMIMGIGRALGDTSDAALDSLFGGAVTA